MTAFLSQLRAGEGGTVVAVDWDRLVEAEARRLRELGIDEGAEVEVLHRAILRGGPIACRVGRMTVALRGSVAGTVHVAAAPGA